MRGLTAACSTTWPWWVCLSLKTLRRRSSDEFVVHGECLKLGRREFSSRSLMLQLCPSGWPPFSESGKCPASPEYQESYPSSPAEQLRAKLLAPKAVWRGAQEWFCKVFLSLLFTNHICSNFLLSVLCQQNNISPAEISQWTNHRVMEWLRSVDLAEYAPNLRGSGVHGGLMVWPCSVEPPRRCSPPDLCTSETISLLRFWSHGSMWRPWLYCWTFLPTRRCCAATSPPISPCWLAQRPSSTNKSVLKTQTTRCSLLPLKWR